MKKVVGLVISFIILLSCTIGVCAAESVPKKILDSTDSVLRIVAEYSDYLGTGTGFVIKNDINETLVVTNYHVVEGHPQEIYTYIDDEMVYAEIVAYTAQKDMCVLSLNYPVKVKALKISDKSAQRGDAVYAVGFPGAADSLTDEFVYSGNDVTITDGIVSAVRSVTTAIYGTPVKYLQISADINPGNSGGPLFNSKGEVVGINTLGIDDSQGIYGAIDIAELKLFLADNNISLGKSVNLTIIILASIVLVLTAVLIVIIVSVVKSEKASINSKEDDVCEAKPDTNPDKKLKFKIKTKYIVFIGVVATVLILILVYVFNYIGLVRYAKSEDFGNKDVLLLDITRLHDPMLYDYIEAGELMYNRNYPEAKHKFESLSGYLDADKMIYESDYRYADYLADYDNFDTAIEIYRQLGQKDYKDSLEKVNDTWFRKATYLFETQEDYLKAYQIMNSLGSNEKYDALTREIEEAIYLWGQYLYQTREFLYAKEYFSVISTYKDAGKYLTLINVRIYGEALPNPVAVATKLIADLDFEDTKDVLMYSHILACEFLKGKWETRDGMYGFEIKEDYTSYNYMPKGQNAYNYYYISQNEWITYSTNKNNQSVLYNLNVIDKDKMEVYCLFDKKTYTLYRK